MGRLCGLLLLDLEELHKRFDRLWLIVVCCCCRPLRGGRGLKSFLTVTISGCAVLSSPTRGRGLKFLRISWTRFMWCRSSPTRGRGLKSEGSGVYTGGFWSSPTRGRGLKCNVPLQTTVAGRSSSPTRGRGLKCVPQNIQARPLLVVPYAGTWIEISGCSNLRIWAWVVPYAGDVD